MLGPTQGCRTRQIQTHCPTNITQGISTHPAAYFPEINCYWKNTVHLERSKCFPNLQKSQESEPSNYRPISLTCVLRKILEHSVASSLAKHFTELDIFDEMQHVLSCVCYVLCASVYMCFVVTCWEKADLLALVCGVFCEFVTFPLVSWVRCGT